MKVITDLQKAIAFFRDNSRKIACDDVLEVGASVTLAPIYYQSLVVQLRNKEVYKWSCGQNINYEAWLMSHESEILQLWLFVYDITPRV